MGGLDGFPVLAAPRLRGGVRVVSRRRGEPQAGEVPDRPLRRRRHAARRDRGSSLARARARERARFLDLWTAIKDGGCGASRAREPEPPRSLPRARLPDARALQLLPLGLPGGPQHGREAGRLQARFRHARLELLPPSGRGADLPRPARLWDDLLHLLQHALRVLPERGHLDRQGQRRAGTARTLATMAWILRVEGCHNINWVGGDPTIHLHTIVDAIGQLPRAPPDRRRSARGAADRRPTGAPRSRPRARTPSIAARSTRRSYGTRTSS